MLRLSIIASLAAAALAQTPPTWVSTNFYSGATCTGAPTSGRVESPAVLAAFNGGQKTSCGADFSSSFYSMLTCTNGVAVVQKYTDNKCTVPKTPAEYWVPACTAATGSSSTFGSTCGTGAFPTSGSGIGLTTNTIVAGVSTSSCPAAPSIFFYSAVSAFDTCLPLQVSPSTTIAIKATCAGGVLTGSAYAGSTCTGTPTTVTSSCVSISGVPVTLSCTTPPAKSGAATVVAGVVATVAAAAAAVALA